MAETKDIVIKVCLSDQRMDQVRDLTQYRNLIWLGDAVRDRMAELNSFKLEKYNPISWFQFFRATSRVCRAIEDLTKLRKHWVQRQRLQ